MHSSWGFKKMQFLMGSSCPIANLKKKEKTYDEACLLIFVNEFLDFKEWVMYSDVLWWFAWLVEW